MPTAPEQRLQRIIDQTHDRLLSAFLPLCKDRSQCDDIMQETYIRIWQNIDQITDDETIFALVKKYARNCFLDELRRIARRKTAFAEMIKQEHALSPCGEEILAGKEYQAEIQTAINKLPTQQQLIFRMHKEHAMSYKQIAEQLGLATGTIEKQMGRALRFLRNELGHLYYADRAIWLASLYCGLYGV